MQSLLLCLCLFSSLQITSSLRIREASLETEDDIKPKMRKSQAPTPPVPTHTTEDAPFNLVDEDEEEDEPLLEHFATVDDMDIEEDYEDTDDEDEGAAASLLEDQGCDDQACMDRKGVKKQVKKVKKNVKKAKKFVKKSVAFEAFGSIVAPATTACDGDGMRAPHTLKTFYQMGGDYLKKNTVLKSGDCVGVLTKSFGWTQNDNPAAAVAAENGKKIKNMAMGVYFCDSAKKLHYVEETVTKKKKLTSKKGCAALLAKFTAATGAAEEQEDNAVEDGKCVEVAAAGGVAGRATARNFPALAFAACP